MFGGLSEMHEQAIGVLALEVTEVAHCPRVQELMEKPTAISPLGVTSHGADNPREIAHT